MIPTIETIVRNLIVGTISEDQAVAWLLAHAEGATNELRDAFAMAALPDVLNNDFIIYGARAEGSFRGYHECAAEAYAIADAMLAERSKST